ncbi:MAG: ATP synthase F1 subunit delta [Chitinophagales bacterium]
MSAEKLANRYADALFSESTSTNKLEQSYADLQVVADAIAESREFSNYLKSPIIDSSKKLQAFKEIFGSKVQATTMQFLDIIINNKRESYLPLILSKFFSKYNQTKGIAEVNVTVATELDADTQKKIEDYIKKESGKANVKINQKIDTSILGGFIVDFGDKILDNSVKQKLKKVKQQILN